MNRAKVFLRIIVIMMISSLLLTACSDSEWDLAAEFFEVWAEENGLVVDGELQIDDAALGVIKDTVDDISNSEKNVQLDGLDVIRDIEEAEELSDQAVENLNREQMERAIGLRPNDWLLHEKDAVIWGSFHNAAAADSALLQSDTLLKESLEQGGDCLAARRAQLEARLEITWNEIMRQEGYPKQEVEATQLRNIHDAARQELQDMNEFHESPFCDGF